MAKYPDPLDKEALDNFVNKWMNYGLAMKRFHWPWWRRLLWPRITKREVEQVKQEAEAAYRFGVVDVELVFDPPLLAKDLMTIAQTLDDDYYLYHPADG